MYIYTYRALEVINRVIHDMFENDKTNSTFITIPLFVLQFTKKSSNVYLTDIMNLNKAFLAIVAVLRIGTINAVVQSGLDEVHELLRQDFLEEELQQRSLLAAACNLYYYQTEIGIYSSIAPTKAISCSSKQVIEMTKSLEMYFDEVVTLDEALKDMTLNTTLCTPKTRRLGLLVNEDEVRDMNHDQQDHRKLSVYRWTRPYSLAGYGICRSCSADNKDRRLLMREDDNEQPSFQEERGDRRELREAYTVVNFDTRGDGTKISTTPYIKNSEYYSSFGMSIRVKDAHGGYNPGFAARIFNSATPLGDVGLGTPNGKCAGGGPGVGTGGEPNKEGQNCRAKGNLLIVQKSMNEVAQPNPLGGEITFQFESSARIGHIGIVGVSGGYAELETPDGVLNITFTSAGTNAAQSIPIGAVVTEMTVHLTSSAGISEIGIFTPTLAKHALSPALRSRMAKTLFEEYVPYLEFELSYYLTWRLNQKYGLDASSCLYKKWATCDVQLKAVSSLTVAKTAC